MDFTNLTNQDVFDVWRDALRELRRRELIWSGNLVGDYAEYLVAQRLNLVLARKGAKGFDAVSEDGTRYQVKARIDNGGRGDRELGVIKNIDRRDFDWLVVVLFEENLSLLGMWKLSLDSVRELAKFSKRKDGYVLYAYDYILDNMHVERLI